MATIQIDDIEYYYELHGEGHPLVIIGGYTMPLFVWEPIVNELKDRFQILIFDNQGIGRTKDSGGPLKAESMADGIMKLIERLGFQKPHIIGVSMGGTIAQKIGANYGEKIDKLVLVVTSAKWRQAMLRGLGTILGMLEKEMELDDIFSATLAWVMGEEFLQDQTKIDQVKEKMVANPYPQTLEDQKRQYQVLLEFDGQNDLKKITAPTLVLYTVEDVIALPYEAQHMADHIPNAKLVECPGGHGVAVSNPEYIYENLKKFL